MHFYAFLRQRIIIQNSIRNLITFFKSIFNLFKMFGVIIYYRLIELQCPIKREILQQDLMFWNNRIRLFNSFNVFFFLNLTVFLSVLECGCYLAALTGQQAIVVSGHFVSTHRTQLFQVIIIWVFHNLQSHTCYTHTHVHIHTEARAHMHPSRTRWQKEYIM